MASSTPAAAAAATVVTIPSSAVATTTTIQTDAKSTAVPLSELNGVPDSSPFKGSVTAALSGKNILLTGATGFLGKIVIEKILRSVPTVGVIFVLVRPRKGAPASERLEKEVISSEVFTRLRRERPDADAFIRKKLVPVAGELTQKGVGFSDEDLRMLCDNVNIIIHCAAVVDFNERLDRALELNTLGTLRLLDVAKSCRACGAFLHVSTAYVNSNKQGWIDEKVYPLPFDAETMIKKIRGMRDTDLEKITVSGVLGDWPNTYTFTKAMTETLLVQKRGRVPLVICRPSIIGSCWKEPVPGWVDCISAAGAVYMSVAFGVLKFLPGDVKSIADIVPADYVVNAMLAAIPAIYNQDRYFVSHATTSTEKALPWGIPRETIIQYFSQNPPDKQLATPHFLMIPSPQEYQLQFFLRYSIPSALLNTLAALGNKATKDKAQQFNKLVWRVRVIIEAFRHFTENEWFFDNKHTRACYHALTDSERVLFPLSLEDMDWFVYNRNFGYGLTKFVLKGDVVDIDHVESTSIQLTKESFSVPKKGIAGWGQRLFSDGHWSYSHMEQRDKMYPQPRPVADMRALILSSAAVQAAIKADAARAAKPKASKSQKGPLPSALEVSEARARAIIERMFADQDMPVMGGMAYGFRKIWRRLYKNIKVDSVGVERVREIARKNGPIIFIPTHRSYIDFLIVSYMCFAVNLPLPYIAAGEDFLGILLVRWLFRKSGAFFLRRSFLGSSDQLYSIIFREYVQRILTDGQSLEFFIEGTRSRSGKMLHPKMGLLSIITDVFLDKKIPTDITMLPLSINYEKTMEGDLYSSELQGDSKIRESLRSLLASSSVLNINFGQITLKMADPISMRDYTSKQMELMRGATQLPPRLTYTPNPGPMPTFVEAASVKAPLDDEEGGVVERKESSTAMTTTTQSSEFKYDPYGCAEHRKHLNRQLAYKIVYDLSRTSECMCTHLVATLMLMYRQGITKAQLVRKVDWLRQEVIARGMKVVGTDGNYRTSVVDEAMVHLRSTIVQRRQNVYEPAILARHEYKNMLVLGHYRNKIAHLFWLEGLVACALYALVGHGHDGASSSSSVSSSPASAVATVRAAFSGGRASAAPASASVAGMEWKSGAGVDKEVLLHEARFLHSLLHREFIYKEHPDAPDSLEGIIDTMVKRGILKVSAANRVEVASTGEAHFSFLCALLWPFIDSYFVAAMILFSLQADRVVEEGLLLQRTQWLATTLYHESMLCFYESCSLETLRNAFVVLQEWKVIKLAKGTGDKRTQTFVSMTTPFTDEEPLEELVARMSRLRKQPPVRKSATRKNLIADIPILAKL